jgi:DNA repair exonuclease SbcCD nuclease subunit
MKILCLGDCHITDSRPVNRIDNYWETVLRKFTFILDTAIEEEVAVIVSPGDLTDTPTLSNIETYQLIDLFKQKLRIPFLTTWGQHDLRFRTKQNTSLNVLYHAVEDLYVLDSQYGYEKGITAEGIVFKGCPYGEEPQPPVKGQFNILLIHKMIINELLWSEQQEYEASNIFLRRNPYDLIVSGDNHQGFISKSAGDKRLLVNCGAMMRNKIDQVDHKPFIVLFDTETKKYKQIFIPIEPAEKVFRIEKVAVEKERNTNLESFVSGLSEQKEIGLAYEDNLQTFSKENDSDLEMPEIMNIIYKSMRRQ